MINSLRSNVWQVRSRLISFWLDYNWFQGGKSLCSIRTVQRHLLSPSLSSALWRQYTLLPCYDFPWAAVCQNV